MDFVSALFSGIGGGLGAVLGVLLGYFLKGKKTKLYTMIIPAVFSTFIDKIIFTLPKEYQDRAFNIKSKGTTAAKEDACCLMKVILKGANNLGSKEREYFLRTMARYNTKSFLIFLKMARCGQSCKNLRG